MTALADRRLRLMGTSIRILVGPPARAGLPGPAVAAARVERFLRGYDERLSRFRPGSELCALNADPRPVVPASPLLRDALRAALAAAERSGGLVDPVLLYALEAAGYRASWDAARRLDLREALAAVPAPRRPARPHPDAPWRAIRVDDAAGTVARPPGLRLDTGGTGKGHAADLAGRLLAGYAHWAVDCGGDVRIGGEAGAAREIAVEPAFGGAPLPGFTVRDGAVATSGLRSRIWRGAGGAPVHHLLDPATGAPAFTGLVAATALAPTAAEAEALAKTALLRGPAGARAVLARHGGLVVDEAGAVQRWEPGARRVPVPVRRAA